MGHSSRLETELKDPRNRVIATLVKLHGVGVDSANLLYDLGARSVQDVRDDPERTT